MSGQNFFEVFPSKNIITHLGLLKNINKISFFGQKPAFLEPSKSSWNFTWKSSNSKIGSKSVNFGPIALKGLFGRGIKKYWKVLHARKSSGQEKNNNGHQKLGTWGANIFFTPSSDFFHQKAKKVQKFMQIWMVVSKIMRHQFLTSKRPNKCFFSGNYPKKVFIFQIWDQKSIQHQG